MKTIWCLRHGDNVLHPDWRQFGVWQSDSPLSEAGRATIVRVRTTYLQGERFAALYTSPFRRTRETANIAVPDGKWDVLSTLAPRLQQVWDILLLILLEGGPRSVTCEEIESRWPGLLQVEAEWVLQSIHKALDTLQDGEQALLVGHQPLLGLLRGALDPRFSFLDGPLDGSLSKGGIYRFKVADLTHVEVEYLPPPE